MGLGPMLVELELALQRSHRQFEGHDPGHHPVPEVLAQRPPLLRVRRLVVADEFLQQRVLGGGVVDQRRLHRAMHRQVVPGGHPGQIGVDLGRQVGVRAEKRDHRLRTRLQIAPMRIGPRAVAQQHQIVAALFQMQRQVRDEGQAVVVHADQAGERMGAHQVDGGRRVLSGELGRQVHGGQLGRMVKAQSLLPSRSRKYAA